MNRRSNLRPQPESYRGAATVCQSKQQAAPEGRQPNERETCVRCGRRKHSAGEKCPAL